MNDVTQILLRIESGDRAATDELLPLVYEELRALAEGKVAQEKSTQALQATALVHEAYLRLVGSQTDRWENRAHFFAAAAESMRRILVDQARARNRIKRGGDIQVFSLDTVGPLDERRAGELLQLSDALDELAAQHPEKAKLVKFKYFVGLSNAQAAELLGISLRTAERDWAFARAWLYREMSQEN